MGKKRILSLLSVSLLAVYLTPAVAQETSVRGSLSGTVYDTTGAIVPAAKVTLTGATGTRSLDSDGSGNFSFPLLIPGIYSVKVEKQGFKAADVKNIEVFTDRTTAIRVTLQPGELSQTVEVTSAPVAVDTSSTAIGTNLTDNFYQQIPVGRNVSELLYLSPGVTQGVLVSSGAPGVNPMANPSISGGSALENLYVADGVNITDPAFNGLGVFSRNFGSLGSGITLSFIKEVQVKTGGYEPQYGRSTGGVIQIVTKSGSKDFHGAIAGYFSPQQMEATRKNADDFNPVNQIGKTVHAEGYDADGELGGYVPGLREKLFFFGSINPAYNHAYVLPPPSSGLFTQFGQMLLRTNTLNYAAKLTFKLTDRHVFESSVFGDPTHTGNSPWPAPGAGRNSLNALNPSVFSNLKYGTRNWVTRWNGTLSPTWLMNISAQWSNNHFTETPAADLFLIVDQTQTAGLPGQVGSFTAQGLGFIEGYEANNYAVNFDTSKEFHFLGKHTFNVGYGYSRPIYDNVKSRSGGRFPIPGTNATGGSPGIPASAVGKLTNATFSLQIDQSGSCTLCPLMKVPGFGPPQPVFLNQDRGEFGGGVTPTSGKYHAAYIGDSWGMSKYLTVNVGLRWEQQRMDGSAVGFTFVDNWSPRVGVIVDPRGNRKSKIYGSFGRYQYVLPLDVAIRSLSTELDFINAAWAPDFDPATNMVKINSQGTVTPVLDAKHLLNNANGGIAAAPTVSLQAVSEAFLPGTRMEYNDEFVIGYEREFKGGIVITARYLDRRLKRVIEDQSGVPVEAAVAGIVQTYVIGNPSSKTDVFTNLNPVVFAAGAPLPAACIDKNGNPTPFVLNPVKDTFGKPLGAICYPSVNMNPWTDSLGNIRPDALFGGEPIPDGQPDGYVDPRREYKAVEIEVNKAFSKNWQMHANWRIAKLRGNYEGAFRNDNQQTDPGISSVFDFTPGKFNLIGQQLGIGTLNTDRRHVVNVYTSYVLDRSTLQGMTFGIGVRVQSGVPLSTLAAQQAYVNTGEVPLFGRGDLGRAPVTGTVDVHVDYPWKFSDRMRLRLGIDLFNIANRTRTLLVNENPDLQFGVKNVDFKLPTQFVPPFHARAMVRLEF
jgi:hypothetical protein